MDEFGFRFRVDVGSRGRRLDAEVGSDGLARAGYLKDVLTLPLLAAYWRALRVLGKRKAHERKATDLPG